MGVQGVFEFPKPVRLIKHLVAIAGGPNAVVPEPAKKSRTTAQAVLELNAEDSGNRSFHLVQLPQPTAQNGALAWQSQLCRLLARAPFLVSSVIGD